MCRVKFLVPFVLLSLNIYSQSGWFQINSGTTDNLYAIQFVNNQTGFINANGGYGQNRMLKTTNTGFNWIITPLPHYGNILGFCFTSADTGYISGDGGMIKKTTNSGINWFNVSPDTSQPLYYQNMLFLNQSTGFVIGHEKIYKSTNAGLNWIIITNTPGHILYSLTFISQTIGYVIFDNYPNYPSINKTTNGGYNWATVFTFNDFNFFSLYFCNDSVAYTQHNYYPNYIILKTTNGGLSWSTISTFSYYVYVVWFFNENTGFLIGDYGRILKTSNGGINWINQVTTGGPGMHDMFFLDNFTGFVTGPNGLIKKTTTGGEPIGIQLISNEIPNHFSLSQNYPNPFNPITKIRFDIPSVGIQYIETLLLRIYDILGREVATLVNEQLKPGTYEVEWNASDYPSGTYFYRISAGDYFDTKKMILIK